MLKISCFLNFLNKELLTRGKTGGKVIQNKEQKSTFIVSFKRVFGWWKKTEE